MTSDIKTKYPSTSSVALTLTLASLATDSSLLAGRASTAVDNSSNLDLDHIVSGVIRTGTSPTVGTSIEIWAYGHRSVASGTPTYPDSITGSDANKTMTSSNVKTAAMVLLAVIYVDNTSNRDYDLKHISIANAFGYMPPYWGLFVVHNTAAALNATQTALQYYRQQAQTT